MNDNVDIISKIEEAAAKLTRKELLVAKYVLKYPERVIYTSINILADECGVGDSTVFRFCRSLKINGYQEFKLLLAQSIQQRNAFKSSPVIPRCVDDDLEAMVDKVYEAHKLALKETMERIDFGALSRTVELLIMANRVLVSGVGTSLVTGLDVVNRFLRITDKFYCYHDSHQQTMAASLLTEKDILLAISFSGSTKDMVLISETAKERNAKIVCITRFEKSPLSKLSDITLLCGADEDPYQGGSVSGKVAQLLLLDMMYNEYYRRTHELSTQNNIKTTKSVLEKIF
jgi:DNA-binding MurR/RpiR family transcriptional regulator